MIDYSLIIHAKISCCQNNANLEARWCVKLAWKHCKLKVHWFAFSHFKHWNCVKTMKEEEKGCMEGEGDNCGDRKSQAIWLNIFSFIFLITKEKIVFEYKKFYFNTTLKMFKLFITIFVVQMSNDNCPGAFWSGLKIFRGHFKVISTYSGNILTWSQHIPGNWRGLNIFREHFDVISTYSGKLTWSQHIPGTFWRGLNLF